MNGEARASTALRLWWEHPNCHGHGPVPSRAGAVLSHPALTEDETSLLYDMVLLYPYVRWHVGHLGWVVTALLYAPGGLEIAPGLKVYGGRRGGNLRDIEKRIARKFFQGYVTEQAVTDIARTAAKRASEILGYEEEAYFNSGPKPRSIQLREKYDRDYQSKNPRMGLGNHQPLSEHGTYTMRGGEVARREQDLQVEDRPRSGLWKLTQELSE